MTALVPAVDETGRRKIFKSSEGDDLMFGLAMPAKERVAGLHVCRLRVCTNLLSSRSR